jgi:hypothetical protein
MPSSFLRPSDRGQLLKLLVPAVESSMAALCLAGCRSRAIIARRDPKARGCCETGHDHRRSGRSHKPLGDVQATSWGLPN